MSISRMGIDRCLARLVAAGIKPPPGVTAQAAAEFWTDKLKTYQPRAVEAAFERWLDEFETWPVPKRLLPLVDAEQARIERRLAPPVDGGDRIAGLNRAIDRAMSTLPSSALLRLHALRTSRPDDARELVNRFAEWAEANPDAGPVTGLGAFVALLPPDAAAPSDEARFVEPELEAAE